MPTNQILVVGGAGFTGSNMLLLLKQIGYSPIVLDNLSRGHRDAVGDIKLIEGNLGDPALLKDVFTNHQITAVIHLASLCNVSESIYDPGLYYHNNVTGLLNLLKTMAEHSVKNLVFSSTAAVYGSPHADRISEGQPLKPESPYGRSMRMAEEIIIDAAATGKLDYIIFRYFNAAGADPLGRAGERHANETHLIPLILQVAAGKKDKVTINGADYPTGDGTCVRDYVHVTDICGAHLLALKALQKGKKNLILNLGTGMGYTVKQVIAAVKRITQKEIPTVVGKMRAGDAPKLIADAELANQELGWQPRHRDLDTIILHAWQYMQKNPQ